MVKKNWFNGIQMPSIVIRRANGKMVLAKSFNYSDYLSSLS
jgi:carboxynorspermidine decarboxylase